MLGHLQAGMATIEVCLQWKLNIKRFDITKCLIKQITFFISIVLFMCCTIAVLWTTDISQYCTQMMIRHLTLYSLGYFETA